MMLLYNIKPDEIDANLKPIALSEMVDLMTNATFYAAY